MLQNLDGLSNFTEKITQPQKCAVKRHKNKIRFVNIQFYQELYDGDSKPVYVVDGWNAWFNSDIKNLPKVWPGLGKNKVWKSLSH